MTRKLGELQDRIGIETLTVAGVIAVAVVGALAAGLLVAPASAPLSASIAEGDSMGTDGPTVVVYGEHTDASIGDVVALDAGDRILYHRVVDETSEGYVTQGDAEPYPDQAFDVPHGTEETIVGVGIVTIPYEVALGGLLGVLALLGLLGSSLYRRQLSTALARARASSRRLPARQLVAITFAVLLTLSIVGPGVIMLPGVDSDHDGTAAAEIENSSLNQTKDVSAAGDGQEVLFNDDGTKMYYLEFTNHQVHEYSLSTPWDISTASKTGTTYTPGHNIKGAAWGTNGEKLYIVDYNDDLQEHTLSTAYDISTASGPSASYTTPGTTNRHDLFVGNDGKTIYSPNASNELSAFHLSSANDLSSGVSSVDSYSGNSNLDFRKIGFNGDGSKMYVQETGSNFHRLREYDLSTPWDITTASDTGNTQSLKGSSDANKGFSPGKGGDKWYGVYEDSANGISNIREFDATLSGYGVVVDGEVTDSEGNALNATVSLKQGGSTVDSMATDSSGGYKFEAVEDGDYELVADADNYTSENASITVAGAAVTQNFTLYYKHSGVVADDETGQPIPNATVEVWRADEQEIKNQLGTKESELTEKANELLRDSRDVEPDGFDRDRKVLEDDAAYGDVDGEVVLVHTASEWDLSGYETRYGVVSRDIAPELGGPDTVHSAGERLVLSVWVAGESSWFEDDVDGSVEAAQTVEEDREVVIEQVVGADSVADQTLSTREFVEVTDVSANRGTKTHYATTTDVPKGYYRVYKKGEPEKATYHVVGNPDEVNGLIEQDMRDEADQYTSKAEEVRDRIDSGIFERQRVSTDENGRFNISLSGPLAIQAYKSDAPNLEPGAYSIEEARSIHESEQYLGTVYLSTTPKHVDTREIAEDDVVRVEATRADGLPNRDLDLNDQIVAEVLDHLENGTTVVDEPNLEGDLSELQSTRDTLLSMVEGNAAVEAILAEIAPEHTTNGDVDLKPVSEYNSESEAYSDQIFALRTALERAPSSQDSETGGEIEDELLNMRLTTGGIRDGADLEDVSVLVHWQDGTSEPIPEEYWHIERQPGSGDAVVVEDYPVPANKSHATVEILAETNSGETTRGRERFENPAFEGEHLRFRSLVASTLTPGASEPVSLRPRLEDDHSAQLVNATVRSPSGETLETTIESDDTVRFTTSGEGAHSVRLEYDDAGTTWVKTTRITAREHGLDTPPAVHERRDDGQYAVASGLEDAEVDDEAAGTVTRMTAVIGAGEHAPGVVHFHPKLESADETVRVEVKSGEYRETVNNRVSTAVHAELSDDALVWAGGTPIDEDGSTSAGTVQRSENGPDTIRTMTGENGETTVRVVQDPSWYQQLTHSFGAWIATVTIEPVVSAASATATVVVETLSTATIPAADTAAVAEVAA